MSDEYISVRMTKSEFAGIVAAAETLSLNIDGPDKGRIAGYCQAVINRRIDDVTDSFASTIEMCINQKKVMEP